MADLQTTGTVGAGVAKPGSAELERSFEQLRPQLTGYCYRMLGSAFEAEDAVQETMVRAWRGLADFEGRSALRSWLYRIATNVCLDQLSGRQRRALPMDMSGSPWQPVEASLTARRPGTAWVEPVLDRQVVSDDADPAEQAVQRESIRLAFVAALQHLPPKQRGVLILREVLHWKASEVAELLGTSVASVNSALQRARATLDGAGIDLSGPAAMDTEEERELLARYVDAFERYDVASLVSLLHEDATQTMPPWRLWLRGREEIGKWFLGQGIGCKGSKLITFEANGRPAYASYKPSGPDTHHPWGICVVEMEDGRITALQNFIYPQWFPAFGLPSHLENGQPVSS